MSSPVDVRAVARRIKDGEKQNVHVALYYREQIALANVVEAAANYEEAMANGSGVKAAWDALVAALDGKGGGIDGTGGGIRTDHSYESSLQNCYAMARRQIRGFEKRGDADSEHAMPWRHILRFCEEAGLRPSILRGEATEAAPAPAGPDPVCVACGRVHALDTGMCAGTPAPVDETDKMQEFREALHEYGRTWAAWSAWCGDHNMDEVGYPQVEVIADKVLALYAKACEKEK